MANFPHTHTHTRFVAKNSLTAVGLWVGCIIVQQKLTCWLSIFKLERMKRTYLRYAHRPIVWRRHLHLSQFLTHFVTRYLIKRNGKCQRTIFSRPTTFLTINNLRTVINIVLAWGTLIGNGHDNPADPSHWRREDGVPTTQ